MTDIDIISRWQQFRKVQTAAVALCICLLYRLCHVHLKGSRLSICSSCFNLLSFFRFWANEREILTCDISNILAEFSCVCVCGRWGLGVGFLTCELFFILVHCVRFILIVF